MSTATIGDIYKPPIGREYRERGGDDHYFRGVSLLELEERSRNDVARLFAEHAGLRRMRLGENASPVAKLAMQVEPLIVFTGANNNSGEGRVA